MWNRFLCSFIFLTCIVIGYAQNQNDGRYRPPTTVRPRNVDGRYRSLGDGRYRPLADGRYKPSGDGRYRSGQDGRYVHNDVKYIHDDRPDGGYKDNSSDSDKYVQSTKQATENIQLQKKITPNQNILKPTENQYNKEKKPWTIIHLRDKVDKDGYEYVYETENGILAEEIGRIQKLTSDDGLRSEGFYEYTGDDGKRYRVDYVADDNGFVPIGEHIPTTPPHVKKLIDFLQNNNKPN